MAIATVTATITATIATAVLAAVVVRGAHADPIRYYFRCTAIRILDARVFGEDLDLRKHSSVYAEDASSRDQAAVIGARYFRASFGDRIEKTLIAAEGATRLIEVQVSDQLAPGRVDRMAGTLRVRDSVSGTATDVAALVCEKP